MVSAVAFSLIILPLVFCPICPIFYEVPKVWATLATITLICIATLFNNKNLSIKKVFSSKLLKIIVVFALWILLASFAGVDFPKSIIGNYYRFDGIITIFQLLAFSVVVALTYNNSWNKKISWGIFLGATLSSIFNNFGQPNFFAGYVLVGLPFAIYLFVNNKNKYLKTAILIGALLQIVLVIKTGSIVGVMGIILIPVLWLVAGSKKLFNKWSVLALFIIVSISAFWINKEGIIRKNLSEISSEGRYRIYHNVFLGAVKKPLLGYGWVNVNYAFEAVEWPIEFLHDVYVDKAHMAILEVFATTGIVGLFIYSYFLLETGKAIRRKKDNWGKTLFLSFLLYILFSQTNVTSISQEYIFWMVVGMAMGMV